MHFRLYPSLSFSILLSLSFFLLLSRRISDLGKTIKAAAPIFTEKFQLGVEAQFARMLFAVVALFYISWTTIVVSEWWA